MALVRGLTGSEVIKLFLCSAQLSMKFIMLINVKMPKIVGILIFIGWHFNLNCWHFNIYQHDK